MSRRTTIYDDLNDLYDLQLFDHLYVHHAQMT